jgi:hexosaminidase
MHGHLKLFLSRIIAKAVLLLLVVVTGEASINEFGSNKKNSNGRKDNNTAIHRIFPAAKIESYNRHNLPSILGVLSRSDNISFDTSVLSASHQTTDDNSTTSVGSDATNGNAGTTRHSSSKHDTKNIDDVLKPAMARFQNSLRKYPEFQDDYPVNPTGLPLVSIVNTFLIALKSPDVNLYHGVPEDYEIHVSVERTTTVLSRTEGVFGDDTFHETRNDSGGDNNKDVSTIDRNYSKGGRFATISIKASTVFGALRALETLGQLLEFGWMDKTNGNHADCDALGIFVIRDLPLHIFDEPAFPYRGLMIDTARHYLPMDLILDNLDAMAMNKMNILHWHISDSNSFPYAPKNLPELAHNGAYHPKRIYTPENVRTLIQEAYLRGIRVIPEIDMPGHTNAIAASHPEVMSHCPKPSEPMNPTIPETYDFIFEIYQDLDTIFPDKMVHLGGDEVQLSEACWLKDPSIAKWMREHGMGNKTVELYEYFETHLLQTIAGFGKTPIVWQEVFDLNLTIPKDAIIDVWKGFDRYSIQNATNEGYRVILSGCWYLDHLDQTWQKFYECDPLNFTSAHKELMIGGHASMWTEHADASNFISRVWPRASSAAERLWHETTDHTAKGAAANIAERIHKFRCRMVLMGFPAGPTGPGVCPTEVTYARRDKRESSANQGPRSNDQYDCVGDNERAGAVIAKVG